jgi:hypothetical protein
LGHAVACQAPASGLRPPCCSCWLLTVEGSAIAYPAVALLWLYWTQREVRQARWWLVQTALLVVPLLVYFPLRYVALEHRLFRTEPVVLLTNPLMAAAGCSGPLAR